MLGYRKRLALMALLLCATLMTSLFDGLAHADAGQTIELVVAQPTPPINANTPADAKPAPPDRPYPTIIPHLLAPPVKQAAAVFAPAPPPAATPLWEAPIGPASNWQNTENYLILGTDRRAGAGDWRTDTIMVVGLDRAQRRAAVFSIPRDLYLEIPNYGYGRINQADFLGERNAGTTGGGPQLVSQIISKTLGIETKHWVRFQMDGFVRVVDAVGGVTVHLDCPFYEPIFNLTTQSWDFFTLPAGANQLDGDSAYWFVRLRLRESDIGRSARQRQFLWALRDKMLSANLITRFPELWGAFQDSFATDLSLIQLIDLVSFGLSLNADNVRAGGLTLADLQNYQTEQGAAVLRIVDPGRVRAIVNGVWEAPAMASSYRRDPAVCPPLPQGVSAEISANGDVSLITPPNASKPITETVGDN
jgi:LCP family protein required for cell wall assembly